MTVMNDCSYLFAPNAPWTYYYIHWKALDSKDFSLPMDGFSMCGECGKLFKTLVSETKVFQKICCTTATHDEFLVAMYCPVRFIVGKKSTIFSIGEWLKTHPWFWTVRWTEGIKPILQMSCTSIVNVNISMNEKRL